MKSRKQFFSKAKDVGGGNVTYGEGGKWEWVVYVVKTKFYIPLKRWVKSFMVINGAFWMFLMQSFKIKKIKLLN